ncbi:hypothetical protein IAT40_006747 [Kwoniella sp. CBS 6097]
MGRKKIEIRPLVDERNRNVTFLKRKAGLMKKAWELSVLCAADVSIVIFSAAGKAYEFSSKELESELDRYYDYEGMIERRRAPEFAAMALAGEDDDDDDDEAGPSRRDSVSKGGKNNTAASAAANGGPPQPRSLKGKETFKARSARHGQGQGHESSSRKKGKKKRSKSRSASEKRSFIDSILSGDSSDESDSDDREEDARRRRKEDQQYEKERRREKERERKAARRGSDIDRTRDREVERAYGTSDKMMAGLQYALNMHSAPTTTTSTNNADPRYASQYAGPSRETYAREAQVNPSDMYSNHAAAMPVPANVPQLPRLPSDGAAYRLPHSIGHASASQLSQGLTYSPGIPPSSAQYMQTHPHSHLPSQDGLHPSLGGSAGFVSAAGLPPTAPAGFQWDQNLIARYAEFQLQQNHQRQQRILLEKQRQQLAHLGVPLDDRSLLDEIFGGMSSSGGGGAGGSVGGNGGRGEYIPMEDNQPNAGSGEFIWPLAGSSGGGGGGNNRPSTMETPLDEGPVGGYDFHPQSQAQSYGSGQPGLNANGNGNVPQGGHGDWSFEVFDQGDGREGMSLPSPVSASNGEGRRKGRGGREYEDEGIPKRMRVA